MINPVICLGEVQNYKHTQKMLSFFFPQLKIMHISVKLSFLWGCNDLNSYRVLFCIFKARCNI